MTDTFTVRDHSQPCEHKRAAENLLGYWRCVRMSCPGGKEIVLRPNDIMYVEVTK